VLQIVSQGSVPSSNIAGKALGCKAGQAQRELERAAGGRRSKRHLGSYDFEPHNRQRWQQFARKQIDF
jgi:hypothetical protein